MRLFLLLLAVLLLPVPAVAADWNPVGMNMDEGFMIFYVDKASVFHQSDGHYRAWAKKEDTLKKAACAMRTGDKCMKEKEPEKCKTTAAKLCPYGERQ